MVKYLRKKCYSNKIFLFRILLILKRKTIEKCINNLYCELKYSKNIKGYILKLCSYRFNQPVPQSDLIFPNEWSNGLCDCFSDCGDCLCAYCCLPWFVSCFIQIHQFFKYLFSIIHNSFGYKFDRASKVIYLN